MKKRKFAEGGSTAPVPSSGIGSPSMIGKRPTSADALRYLRATGNKAGADEILKAAVGKPAKMPEDYGNAFKAGADSGSVGKAPLAAALPRAPTAAETAQLTRAASSSAPDMNVMRNAAQPGPRAPVAAPSAPVDRGPPMSAPGSPVNVGGPSMGLGSTPPGSAQPSMGPSPSMRPRPPMQPMKKGGQAKAYASGGSVKGAGIAQRGVRKCKIV